MSVSERSVRWQPVRETARNATSPERRVVGAAGHVGFDAMEVLDRSALNGREARFVRVASLDELQAKRIMVVKGERCPILVVCHDDRVYALDNRCPHLGFPLDRGSVADGILTCHWHHARFDL